MSREIDHATLELNYLMHNVNLKELDWGIGVVKIPGLQCLVVPGLRLTTGDGQQFPIFLSTSLSSVGMYVYINALEYWFVRMDQVG